MFISFKHFLFYYYSDINRNIDYHIIKKQANNHHTLSYMFINKTLLYTYLYIVGSFTTHPQTFSQSQLLLTHKHSVSHNYYSLTNIQSVTITTHSQTFSQSQLLLTHKHSVSHSYLSTNVMLVSITALSQTVHR